MGLCDSRLLTGWLLGTCCLLLSACGGKSGPLPEGAEPITVLAAASLTEVMEEAAARFQEETGLLVRISTGPSSGLARQVVSGAPVDVFVSASLRWAETVEEAGLAERTVPLLRNRLVLAVPRDNPAEIQTLTDLSSSRVRRVAVAGENVPAGRYAEEALTAAGVLEVLKASGRLVRGHDVRHTLSYISRGEVDAGLVYITDLQRVDNILAAEVIPQHMHQPIVYPLVLLRNGPAGAEGRQFSDFLQSAAVRKIFRKAGFETVPPEPDGPAVPGAADGAAGRSAGGAAEAASAGDARVPGNGAE